jgi:hypothetical protein
MRSTWQCKVQQLVEAQVHGVVLIAGQRGVELRVGRQREAGVTAGREVAAPVEEDGGERRGRDAVLCAAQGPPAWQ